MSATSRPRRSSTIVETPLTSGRRYGVIQEDALSATLTAVEKGYENTAHLLLQAANSGYEKAVAALLPTQGLDKDGVHHHHSAELCGHTALTVASRNGHLGVVKTLLAENVDPNVVRANGFTALLHASQNGHASTAALLLKGGAHLEATVEKPNPKMGIAGGSTPLILACKNGHYDCVQLFLDHSADVDARCPNGYTPLAVACRGGFADVTSLLLGEKVALVSIDTTDAAGMCPTHHAAMKGYIDIMELLIKHGADVNTWFEPAASRVTSSRRMSSMRRSPSQKKDGLTRASTGGENPLSLAAKHEHYDMVELLLVKGARAEPLLKNLKSKNKFGDEIEALLRTGVEGGSVPLRSTM
jgi:ankyrin repeat protein